MHKKENDLLEIDMKELLDYLLGKIWIVFIIAICCAAAFGLYAKNHRSFMYSASASIYIVTQEEGQVSYTDLQLGTQLISDYMTLATSENVINEVISESKLKMNYWQVRSNVFMNNPKDTRVIYFTVTNADNEVALKLVNSFANVVAKRASEIMNVPKSNVIDAGKIVAVYPTINVEKNVVIGGALGFAVSLIILVVLFVQNDTIRSEEDLKKYMKLDLLATIPISYERTKFKLAADHRKEVKREKKYRKKECKQQRKQILLQVKDSNQKEHKGKNKRKQMNEKQTNRMNQNDLIAEAENFGTVDNTEAFEQDWDTIDELKNLDIYFNEADKQVM